MDLNALAVFVKTVDAGSFSAAARLLGITKSSVARTVNRLEDDLGSRLLQRTTRSMKLTEAGEIFYRQTAHILAEVGEACNAVHHLNEKPSGTLRVTAPVEFGMFLLGQLLCDLCLSHPQLQVETELTHRRVDMVEEGFDLAVVIGQPVESSLVSRKLGQFVPRLFASPEYLAQRGHPSQVDDLKAHNCLLLYGLGDGALYFQSAEQVSVVPVTGQLKINSLTVLHQAALRGLGIARLPGFLCVNDLSSGQLVPVLAEFPLVPVPVYVVYPSRRHLSPKVKSFITALEEAIPRNAWFVT